MAKKPTPNQPVSAPAVSGQPVSGQPVSAQPEQKTELPNLIAGLLGDLFVQDNQGRRGGLLVALATGAERLQELSVVSGPPHKRAIESLTAAYVAALHALAAGRDMALAVYRIPSQATDAAPQAMPQAAPQAAPALDMFALVEPASVGPAPVGPAPVGPAPVGPAPVEPASRPTLRSIPSEA